MRSVGVSELRSPRISTFSMASGIVSPFWTAGTMAVLDGGALLGFDRFDALTELLFKIFVRRFGIGNILSLLVAPTRTVDHSTVQAASASFRVQALIREACANLDTEKGSLGLRVQEGIGYFFGNAGVAVRRHRSELNLEHLLFGVIANRADAGRLDFNALHLRASHSRSDIVLGIFLL